MFEKNMRIAFLLDFYGEVLDENPRSIMRAYYEEDLSLSEIASGEGISRQGVRHVIKKCEEQLEFLEEKLGLAAKFSSLEDLSLKVKEIATVLPQKSGEELSDTAKQLYAIGEQLADI
jgi:predicted DNA-binding protein YlxM (UPF0122 family)